MNLVLTVLAAIVTAAALYAVEKPLHSVWAEREITTASHGRTTLVTARYALAAALGAVLAEVHDGTGKQHILIAVSMTALGSLLLLSTDTDIASRKIPYEPCYLTTLIGVVTVAVNFEKPAAVATAVCLAFLTIVWLIGRFTSGLGMGDTRLLVSAAACSAWWTGVEPLIGGIIFACIAQVIVRIGIVIGRLARRRSIKIGFLPFAPALALGIVLSMYSAANIHFGPCDDWPSSTMRDCAPTAGVTQ